MKPALVYARVSTEDQAEKGYSLEGQVEDCLRRAEELGYVRSQVIVITDDVSGTLADRPGLNRLREYLLRDPRPELVVVYDPDRLARKLSLQLLLTDELTKRGVRLEFVNFEWNNTPEGRMFYQLRGMFAEFEREKIRERTIRGRLTKLKTTGKLSWDPRLYGYRFDTEKDELVVEPAAAAVVKRIFSLAAGGNSGEEIARKLMRENVPAPRGSRWHGSTVTRILHNRSYLGEYKAYKTDTHLGYKRKRPEHEQFDVPVEPLVGQELYDAAQKTLDKTRTQAGRPAKREVLLHGLARCFCGRRMVATGPRGGGGKGYYVCSSRLKSVSGQENKGVCGSGYWNAAVVDDAIWQRISGFVLQSRGELIGASRSGAGPAQSLAVGGNTTEQRFVEERLRALEHKRSKLLDLYLSGGVDRTLYDAKLKGLERELKLKNISRSAAEAQMTEIETPGGYLEPLLPDWGNESGWAARLNALSFHERKRLAKLLIASARFGEERTITLQLTVGDLSPNPCVGEGDGGL